MEIPINEKEFDIIVEVLKSKNHQLYAKLWSYKMNNLSEVKKNEKTNFAI
jgi:hypothetical protein